MNFIDNNETLVDLTYAFFSVLYIFFTLINSRSNFNNFFAVEIVKITSKYSIYRKYQLIQFNYCLAYSFYIARFLLLAFHKNNISEYDIYGYFLRHFSAKNDTFLLYLSRRSCSIFYLSSDNCT